MTLLFEQLLTKLDWKASDGPAPGVWSSKPEGSRCLWTCFWSTDSGLLMPDRLVTLDELTLEQAKAELADLAAQKRSYSFLAHQLHEALTNGRPWPNYDCDQLLRSARLLLPEYVAPWEPPKHIYVMSLRPGWAKE
jgi:hypothetical protein